MNIDFQIAQSGIKRLRSFTLIWSHNSRRPSLRGTRSRKEQLVKVGLMVSNIVDRQGLSFLSTSSQASLCRDESLPANFLSLLFTLHAEQWNNWKFVVSRRWIFDEVESSIYGARDKYFMVCKLIVNETSCVLLSIYNLYLQVRFNARWTRQSQQNDSFWCLSRIYSNGWERRHTGLLEKLAIKKLSKGADLWRRGQWKQNVFPACQS